MTRFLLPLEAAVELVEFAFSNGESGDTFVRKAPASTMSDPRRRFVRFLERTTRLQRLVYATVRSCSRLSPHRRAPPRRGPGRLLATTDGWSGFGLRRYFSEGDVVVVGETPIITPTTPSVSTSRGPRNSS